MNDKAQASDGGTTKPQWPPASLTDRQQHLIDQLSTGKGAAVKTMLLANLFGSDPS